MNGKREVVDFPSGECVQVALRWTDGKQVQLSGGAKRIMFTTVDDKVFFLAPEVAQKVHMIQPQPARPFWIRRFKTHGRGGSEKWEVYPSELGSPIPQAGPVEAALPSDASQLERDMARSIDRRQAGTYVSPAVIPNDVPKHIPNGITPRHSARPQQRHDYWVPPDAHEPAEPPHPADSTPQPQTQAPKALDSPVSQSTAAQEWTAKVVRVEAAVLDALAQAKMYAKSKYADLLNEEDVRSTLVSVFINMEKSRAGR